MNYTLSDLFLWIFYKIKYILLFWVQFNTFKIYNHLFLKISTFTQNYHGFFHVLS